MRETSSREISSGISLDEVSLIPFPDLKWFVAHESVKKTDGCDLMTCNNKVMRSHLSARYGQVKRKMRDMSR